VKVGEEEQQRGVECGVEAPCLEPGASAAALAHACRGVWASTSPQGLGFTVKRRGPRGFGVWRSGFRNKEWGLGFEVKGLRL